MKNIPKALKKMVFGSESSPSRCSPVFWKGQIPTEGKRNTYRCAAGHLTNTIHADEGVTPFMMTCHHCGGLTQSGMYTNPDMGEIHGVWSKEPNEWWGSASEQKEHAEQGGVFLYAVRGQK